MSTKAEVNKKNICDDENCPSLHDDKLLVDLYDYWFYCEYEMGNYSEALRIVKKALEITGKNDRLEIGAEMILEKIQQSKNASKKNGMPVEETDLCRFGAFPDSKRRQKMKGFKVWSACKYSTNWNPSLAIRPIKSEVLSKSPFIEFWHQFLTDKEVDKLKELGLSALKRSTVAGDTGYIEASYRVSQSSWLDDSLNETVAATSRRISDMTNFTRAGMETLQVSLDYVDIIIFFKLVLSIKLCKHCAFNFFFQCASLYEMICFG